MTPVAQAGAAVWLIDGRAIDADQLATLRGWLNPAELARCQRFLRRQRRHQFIVGHGLLRLALGEVLDVPAATIELVQRPGLAPRLVMPAHLPPALPSPGFSLSHSGRWIACGFSADTPLGLDIELRDARRDLPALAAQVFGAVEADLLGRLPPAARMARFYQRWSALEACFKLTQGSALAPAPVCVSLPHAQLAIVVASGAAWPTPPALTVFDSLAGLIARANSRGPVTGA